MATLALDKTGTSSANLIVNERHDVSSKTKRIFTPLKGAFFGSGLIIRDASTNKILQPITGYKILHMVREAVLETHKEVYAVILVLDTGVLDVVITYQAVGGLFSNTVSELTDLLGEYLDGTTPTDTIGQIVGAPVQALPQHHMQPISDFQNAGSALAMLEGIRKAIMLGDTNAFGAAYQYIDNQFNDSMTNLDSIKTYFDTKYDEAQTRFTRRNGTVIVTDDDANPGTYTDGKWNRLPNVFLYGTTKNNEVGTTIDVAEGSGLVARKTNFFIRDDQGDGIIRVITANKTSINEGESVNFTLTTVGLGTGSKLAYTLTGIDATDLTTGSLTGEFTINASGVATITVAIKRDFKSEGPEVLKCHLNNFPGTYDSVVINDTSKTPSYKLVLSADNVGNIPMVSVDEGSAFQVVVITTDVDAGTTLYLTYSGGANNSDFVGTLPSSFVVNDFGINYVTINVKEDFLTEGNESLIVNVGTTSNSNDIKVSNSISINDTSKSKVYTTRWSASSTGAGTVSSVNEGDTTYLVVSTENVPQGTILNLTYSGITVADLVDNIPTNIVIYNNLAVIPVTIKADSVTENAETLVVNLIDGATTVSTASIVINDTSKSPTYTLRYSTNSTGTDTILNANEGDTVYAIVETTNVPNGTIVQISYTGLSVADFLEIPTTTATIVGNMAAVKFVIKSDFVTESTEILNMSVSYGGVIRTSKSLTVADTSVSVSGTITFSKTTLASGAVSVVDEDETTIYILYKTVDVPNNTVLGISFEGLESTDIVANFPTTVTIINNAASTSFSINKDWVTEGDQYFLAKLLLPNGAVIQNTLTVRDSSKTPVIDKMFYHTAADNTMPITTIGEDVSMNLAIETTNIPTGTVMNIAWSGTSDASDYTGARPTTITVDSNGKGLIPFTTKPDYVSEATETCIATITLPGTNGTKSATLNIIDTHKPQAIAIAFNTLPDGKGAAVTSVNEGSTVYAILTGTNVLDNQVVNLAWGGNTTDLSSVKPTTVTMVGNKASLTITATADLAREDIAETITLTATTPSGAVGSGTLTINDTSKGYAIATWRTGTPTNSTEIPTNGIDEGLPAVLHLNTFGIPANDALTYTWSGTGITADDFDIPPNGIMSTSNNAGYGIFITKRDYLTDGVKTLNVTVRDSKGNELVTTSVKILDASKLPTFTAVFATDAAGVNTFTSVDEPTSGIKNIYAVVKTTNMFDGDVVQFNFSGDADNADFSGTPISNVVNVTVNNNIGYYNLKLLADNADG